METNSDYKGSTMTMADKILWIVDGRKCESCTDEECLGVSCEGCLADCLLALFAEQQAPLVEALIWCSGSADFNEGGIAREGWLKTCKPLIDSALKEVQNG
jgi:hypothetical protein